MPTLQNPLALSALNPDSMPTQAIYAVWRSGNGTKAERLCTMLEAEAKVQEKSNSSSMPTHTERPEEDVPTEVALAILYTMARRLESKALAQVLTGHTPKGEPVTYIRMTGIIIDPEKGLVLAVPTDGAKE